MNFFMALRMIIGSTWSDEQVDVPRTKFKKSLRERKGQNLWNGSTNLGRISHASTLKFKGTEVSLSFDSYQNNGSLAVLMNTVPDDELYGVITVNLGSFLQTDRLAFVDENNLPGIGAWLRKNKIASPLGYKGRSGFCQYELYAFHKHA